MPSKLPYMSSPGAIGKILGKAKDAKTPERFTEDFLKTVLGCRSSNDRPFIGFAKRLGLLGSDGAPTDLYKKFRSTDKNQAGAAIAQAIRNGYSELYAKNEYAHRLTDDDLKGLIIEITGLASDNQIVGRVLASFKQLKAFANFDASLKGATDVEDDQPNDANDASGGNNGPDEHHHAAYGMNLAYNIHLVLPKTDDVAVFNAIFKSLRENLLKP